MKNSFSAILDRFIPYLIMGVAIALAFAILIMLFHVIIWGALIGIVIFVIMFIKQKFFPSKPSKDAKSGRIIEHDDDKE